MHRTLANPGRVARTERVDRTDGSKSVDDTIGNVILVKFQPPPRENRAVCQKRVLFYRGKETRVGSAKALKI